MLSALHSTETHFPKQARSSARFDLILVVQSEPFQLTSLGAINDPFGLCTEKILKELFDFKIEEGSLAFRRLPGLAQDPSVLCEHAFSVHLGLGFFSPQERLPLLFVLLFQPAWSMLWRLFSRRHSSSPAGEWTPSSTFASNSQFLSSVWKGGSPSPLVSIPQPPSLLRTPFGLGPRVVNRSGGRGAGDGGRGQRGQDGRTQRSAPRWAGDRTQPTEQAGTRSQGPPGVPRCRGRGIGAARVDLVLTLPPPPPRSPGRSPPLPTLRGPLVQSRRL